MQTITEYMKEKYDKREDKDNIFCVGISYPEFRSFLVEYLLGPDFFIVDPIGPTQVNEVILYAILEKYSKRYKKELREVKRRENAYYIWHNTRGNADEYWLAQRNGYVTNVKLPRWLGRILCKKGN